MDGMKHSDSSFIVPGTIEPASQDRLDRLRTCSPMTPKEIQQEDSDRLIAKLFTALDLMEFGRDLAYARIHAENPNLSEQEIFSLLDRAPHYPETWHNSNGIFGRVSEERMRRLRIEER